MPEQNQAERIINRQLQQNASLQFQLLVIQDELEQAQAENEQLRAQVAELQNEDQAAREPA
jgi:cell division protein FtsB